MKSAERKEDKRVRAWFLTVPADGQKGVNRQELEAALKKYTAVAGQLEKSESGYLHWQTVVVHANPIRFSTLKKKLPTAHIEECKDVPASYQYCTKTATRVAGATPLIKGNWSELSKPKSAGERTDLAKLREIIMSSMISLDDLLLEHPHAWKYERMCRALIAARDRKRFSENREDLKVKVYFGATGSGKTRAALAESDASETCRITAYGTGAFDSYSGEHAIVLDEFRGQIDVGLLLNILDVYPMSLPARYENKPAGYKNVVICSNLAPWEWYEDIDTVTKKALFRRLTEVHMFSEDFSSKQLSKEELYEHLEAPVSTVNAPA